jgi:hypothetical protein
MPVNQEWLNANSLRNYPIRENASMLPVDSSGAVITDARLPNNLIVDLVVSSPVPAITDVFLYQLAYVGDLLTFVLHDNSGNQLASISVTPSTHTTYQGYAFSGSGTYDDVRGKLVLGDLSTLRDDLAEGLYTYTVATAPFEAATIRPMLRGVRSMQIVNEDSESDFIYGHVKLFSGANVLLTYLPTYNAIRIDAIDGEGLTEECECPEDAASSNIVRTINGIPIEDVEITGDGQCVNVETEGNRLVITDVCSTPCCGCPELEFLTESLKVLEATMDNLQEYANRLAERIENFVTNFILTIT